MVKRQLSVDRPGKEARRIKTDDSAAQVEAGPTSKESTGPSQGAVQIEVSFRSSSKASRNDPKPGMMQRSSLLQMLRAQLNNGMDQTREFAASNFSLNEAPNAAPPNTCGQESPTNSISDGEGREVIHRSGSIYDEDKGVDDYSERNDGDSIRSSLDKLAEFSWLEQIDTVATKDGTQVAICDAKLIRRRQIRSSFWCEMEQPTRETSLLAFQLFDRYGRLKREYCDHSFKRGSSAWGNELDSGDILLFEKISVKSQQRRKGLGTEIIKAVLDKIRPKSKRFVALASPGFLYGEVEDADKEEMGRHQTISGLFFRSLGFRRVGITPWFAFVDDADHPSRRLKASDDWDESEYSDKVVDMSETVSKAFEIISNRDSLVNECGSQLQSTMPTDEQDASWSATNKDGNNILHLAAMYSNFEAVKYIFSCRPDLASQRNHVGETPLEALKAVMESTRTRAVFDGMTIVRSDEFTGFSQPSIDCITALTRSRAYSFNEILLSVKDGRRLSTNEGIHSDSEIEAMQKCLRLRYGCTCEECIGGFLSPRMRFALLCQAEWQHNMLPLSICSLANGPDWVEEHEHELRFLPASVNKNLKTNKSIRQGFINVCGYIAECLNQNRIPNERNVLHTYHYESNEWPPDTRNYLQGGGTIAAVANMVFHSAMEQDKYSGDGHHDFIFEDQVAKLPECRNDHEFGFVSGMCGYSRISPV